MSSAHPLHNANQGTRILLIFSQHTKGCRSMSRTRRFSGGIIALIAVLLLGACASATTNGGGGFITGPGVDTTAKTITLGILSPTSGPVAAPVGDPLANGVAVFFDHVN